MLKTIDQLVHFTKTLDAVVDIFKYGFKTSYANEELAGRKIMVPMVSFCNILLRDSGEQEILFYGKYGIIVTREWALMNQINPVLYTYKEGLLANATVTLLENSFFLTHIVRFKETIKKYSDAKGKPISTYMEVEGASKQSKALLDHLSTKYDDDLIELISEYAKQFNQVNFSLANLIKPYTVKDKENAEFIAYNDREWRKIYPELDFFLEGSPDYEKWENEKKPHFHNDPYLLHFKLSDIRAVLVAEKEEVHKVIEVLLNQYGGEAEERLKKSELYIGTKEMLEKSNF